ncbi:MAG: DEAD/DEAH box helicase [Verrucomicrobiaceae bacterium]|nr:DEAD/DEAH box helicase [Verrucomicrobiaceae bacterium]
MSKSTPHGSAPKSEKKPSLLSKIKSGLKRLVGIKPKPKAELVPQKDARKHEERRPARAQGQDRPRSEGRSGGEGRRERESSRDRGPRRDREHGGKDRGGRGGSGRDRRGERKPLSQAAEEDQGKPRQRHAPVPPPAAPPVPEGPYPAAFEALGFSPAILAGVRDLGYSTPTTIQEKSAPIILNGKDLIGASQTGTGKTAAFGLPSMSRLGAPGKMRMLILEPTRELAVQVHDSLSALAAHTGLRIVAVYGGVGYGTQREALEKGVDIVVATPGRLLDFMGDGTFSPADIEILILDEVDRMLDMGFLPDVRRIVEKTPTNRQTLFFSATMPPQIKSLADWALKEPESVEVGIRFSPAETVSHYLYPVASDQRTELLLAILKQTHFNSVMIFTRTKMQADELYGELQALGEYKVGVMHSDIKQRDREAALKGFREGTFEIIVATDLAARGLDISGVTHVINYCVPENPEDYVHRIGRTGRAQKEGDAFTLFAADEIKYVESVERLINQKIERRKLEGFSYKFTTILEDERHARSVMRTGKGLRRRR